MTRLGGRVAFGFGLGVAAAALLAVALGAADGRGSGQAGPGGMVARIDRLLSAAYPAGEPGAAVLVSKSGIVILQKGYGLADTERKAPVTADTVFRLASVTKAFTGTAALTLVERGEIALDDPVVKHLSDFPPSGRAITIRHLLSHTSGLPDYLDRPNSMEWARHEYTVQELVGEFKDRPVSFAPGERNLYSNSNYVLLGAIIEKASGMPFGRFVETAIFRPLGMTSTMCGGPLTDAPRLATPYEPARTADDQLDWSRLHVARPYSLSSVYAAGGCVSSITDLARFHHALFRGALVGKPALDRSFRPIALKGGGSGAMSEGGWQLDMIDGRRAAMRLGALPGVCTCLLTMPDEDVAVVLLSNRTPGKPRCGALAVQIAGIVVGR